MSEQERYQIAFDWGVDGAAAVGGDIVVWVDALGDAPVPVDALGARDVVRGDLRTAASVARWVRDRQLALGVRQRIAVIAAGARRGERMRYAVEDQLASGAIIAELGALGIDATSPEAAVAEAGCRGLARAVGHLLTASVSAGETPPAPGVAKADPRAAVDVLRAP
ncbi:hypothetical protein QT381_12470 [Galbitalea sp. SE-J8]|uniref:hypothetical protein n=1 Tax=Galbitalea sp. SE-J8 TaxID=3054952 RepID=UPI00259CFDEE|nr:hypothetical protein [Galbitalea sp. SE-J8]MDM4763822.1 hypothetical protein [Galbitalea sp. SE-J8]